MGPRKCHKTSAVRPHALKGRKVVALVEPETDGECHPGHEPSGRPAPRVGKRGLCWHAFYVVHVINVSAVRNITLTLDEATLREARVLAAERGLSVSAFLRSELAGLVERQRGFERAKASAVKRLRRGQPLGGGRPHAREELHDRAKLR